MYFFSCFIIRVYVGNVGVVYIVQASLLLIGQLGLAHHSTGIGPCFPLAGGLWKFYATAGGNRPTQRQQLLVQYKQQANPFLSMLNYTPLVISRNDKNKQLTLLRQCKLALTARNTLFCYKIIGAPKQFKKWLRPLFRPKTHHTCHQKPKGIQHRSLLLIFNPWVLYQRCLFLG